MATRLKSKTVAELVEARGGPWNDTERKFLRMSHARVLDRHGVVAYGKDTNYGR